MSQSPEHIPFNRPTMVGRELEYIAEAVRGGQIAGNGPFTRRCQAWFEEHYGGAKVLLTTSCTAALEMSALLCDVGEGDEVILPSYTFVTTASAFRLRGATLRFVDIDEETLNLDPARVEEAVSERTKVICPIHYAGVSCEMDALGRLAESVGALIVEDAAQGVGATYQGRYLGTIGALGTYSFHETKNVIAGEGGALVVNNPTLVERAEIILEKGTDRSKFLRGEVDKYSWVDLGSSFLPSELIAAFLLAQLEHAEAINTDRLAAWERYWIGLVDLEKAGRVRLPRIPAEREHNAHMFYILATDEAERQALLQHLAQAKINAVSHYVPLHTSRVGLALGYNPGDLPITEDLSGRLLRLPMFHGITAEQQARVCSAIHAFFGR